MSANTPSRPLLIVVSGLPATGKTTLARLIGMEHQLPVFSRDQFKEQLFDQQILEPATFTQDDSTRLGLEAALQLLAVAGDSLAKGEPLVIESNFRPAPASIELRPYLGIADVRQVHCSLAQDELFRRYKARYERGDRHPVHLDREVLATWGQGYEEGIEVPIPLAAPLMQVATDTGYAPGFAEILRFCDPAMIPDEPIPMLDESER